MIYTPHFYVVVSVKEQLAYFSQHRLSLLHNTGVCTVFPLRYAVLKPFVSHLALIKIGTVYSKR